MDGDSWGALPCGVDCDDTDPGAFGVPTAVANLRLVAPATLEWEDLRVTAGPATTYQVLRGRVDELPVGAGPSELCIGDALSVTQQADADPPRGAGSWYLVRAKNGCSPPQVSYGTDSAGTDRLSGGCP